MSTGTGPSRALGRVAVGPIEPTGTFTVPVAGSFTMSPSGPTVAASFAGAGSCGAHAALQIEANLVIDKTDAILQPAVPTPPRRGELILCFFIRPEHQEERLARFEERFNDWTRRFNARTARRLYYRHALQSIFDILKIGGIGGLIDWIYNHFWGK